MGRGRGGSAGGAGGGLSESSDASECGGAVEARRGVEDKREEWGAGDGRQRGDERRSVSPGWGDERRAVSRRERRSFMRRESGEVEPLSAPVIESTWDQIAFFRVSICTGARRNPVTCGTNQGNSTRRFTPRLRAGRCLEPLNAPVIESTCERALISDKVFIKWFLECQLPHKTVDLLLTIFTLSDSKH